MFGRQIDGKMDLWRMRPDGSEEEQLTFTDDWQEGAPFYLPDNETILTRAWKRSEYGKIRPTPMTVFTVNAETKEITPRTFDRDMNWAPYPRAGRPTLCLRAGRRRKQLGGFSRRSGRWRTGAP